MKKLLTIGLCISTFLTPPVLGMKREQEKTIPADAKKQRSSGKVAPLCFALKEGNIDEATRLLGEDKKSVWRSNKTVLPLYYALAADMEEKLQLTLVSKILALMGPLEDNLLSEALHFACGRNSIPLVQLLLRNNFKQPTSLKTNCGSKALARLKKSWQKMSRLCTSTQYVEYQGILKLAVLHNNEPLINLLFSYNIQISSTEFKQLVECRSKLADAVVVKIFDRQKSLFNEEIACTAYLEGKNTVLDLCISAGDICLDRVLFYAARKNDGHTIAKIRERCADKVRADRLIFAGALTGIDVHTDLLRETFKRGHININQALTMPAPRLLGTILGPPEKGEGSTPLGFGAMCTDSKVTALLLDEFNADVNCYSSFPHAVVTGTSHAALNAGLAYGPYCQCRSLT